MNPTNNNEQLTTEPICEEHKTVYGEPALSNNEIPQTEEIGAEEMYGHTNNINGSQISNENESANNVQDTNDGNKLTKKANDGRFTALGLSGTGKTCFMLGIYDKLMGGNMDTTDSEECAFSLSLQDNEQLNDLKSKWSKLFFEKGYDRYPKGTKDTKAYKFSFNANLKEIQKFEWIDYKGGLISDNSKSNVIRDAILTSDVLYIFVDGKMFVPENKIDNYEEYFKYCKSKVSNECSKQIFPFIHLFTEKNKEIPPVAIVVTKYDLIKKYFNTFDCINCIKDNSEIMIKIIDEINKIIKGSFPVLFAPKITSSASNKLVGIFPVSIGLNISDEEDSGEFKPCQIQAPIFFGLCNILHKLKNVSNGKKKDKEEVFEVLCNQMDGFNQLVRCYMNGQYDPNISLKKMIQDFYDNSSLFNLVFNTPVEKLFRRK